MKHYLQLVLRGIALFIIIINPICLFAQETGYTISLKNQQLHPKANASFWVDSITNAKAKDDVQAYVQFYKLPTTEEKNQLNNYGVTLIGYVDGNAYQAMIHLPLSTKLPLRNIRSINPVNKNWKLDRRILKQVNLNASSNIRLLASFYQKASEYEITNLLQHNNALITDKKFATNNVFEIELPQNKITSIASSPFVLYLSIATYDKTLNADARAGTGATLLALSTTAGGLGLEGKGVTIGIGDNTSAIFHIDDLDRITNFNPAGPTNHGVHTTTTAVGKGIINPKAKGMAPSADVLAHFFNVVWAQTGVMYKDYNMTLTNNSYAAITGDCSFAGTYDQYAQLLDDYALQFPYVQNVFASGNDGLYDCAPYVQPYHTTVGAYQCAKNVLTVGSMGKNHIRWEKSSSGPVNDGRVKPEIVAYGQDLYSGFPNDNYAFSSGTSMACPTATGCMALLTEQYKKLNGNNNPLAYILKGLVINGATDFGNPGPDYQYGFGLINIERSVKILNDGYYKTDSLTNGNNKTFTINVPTNTSQLKVLLYWNDLSAALTASKALVNNLNLEVIEPNNTTHLPLILNSAPSGVTLNAIEGIDTLNNVEQVVINNPQSGNYTFKIKGASIPSGVQPFVLVYDFISPGITIKYPQTTTAIAANDTTRIYWDASNDANTFTLEYSANNGSSWNVISNNIPSTQRHFFWGVPNISTEQGMIRISRNNTSLQATTGSFSINPQPIAQPSTLQCPGYFNINWNAIPNATGYEVMLKKGDDLRVIDTTNATTYSIGGLSTDSVYYAAITPLINGVRGYRSLAIKRKPDTGSCVGNISNGDLKMEAIITPKSGRLFTSSQLSANETLTISIRNLDDVSANNYKVSYNINGGVWTSQNFNTNILPLATGSVSLSNLNLSSTGTYIIQVAVENLSLTDPVKINDTMSILVKQIENAPLNISTTFNDDFESGSKLLKYHDEMAILPNDHWDYTNSTDSGRLRNFVSDDVLISGNRSISMDMFYALSGNQNYLTGTFNIGAYNTSVDEVRFELDYKFHGQPKFLSGNDIYVRGNDTQQWIPIFTFDTSLVEGAVANTTSLSITNALANAGQNFSTSTQIRIGQHDTSAIAANDYGNGLTIDNFKLYTVTNDVQLLSVETPQKESCSLTNNEPLTVKIYNSDNLPQQNISLNYRLNNGVTVSQILPSIAPKDTVLFTFNQTLNISSIGSHLLDVWLIANGDTYLNNDSIINYKLRNQPLITSFPYIENFESGDGNWFSDGKNNSWEYGTPNGAKINKAASGTKVWTTSLSNNYKENELSYLYSPCFAISGLTNPMLSFSLSTDIENCGTSLCDAAYVEYSVDGNTWSKLGQSGEGTNWYGQDFQVWNEQDKTRWRVASIPLPNVFSLKLRFVMRSDNGAGREGIAVDDIHIFDLKNNIVSNSSTGSSSPSSNTWTDVLNAGKIMLQMNAGSNASATYETNVYLHYQSYSPIHQQYFIPRHFTIKTITAPTVPVGIRLFITDDEVLRMLNDKSCDTCAKAEDAYRLSLLKYDDQNKEKENEFLTDNIDGHYTILPFTSLQWVPYDNGYYAQTELSSFSELWFTTRIPKVVLNNALVYPNPVINGTLNILWTAKPSDKIEIALYDMVGKKVYSTQSTATDYDNYTTIHLPPLSSGMYLLKYTTGSIVKEEKIIVH